MIKSQKTNINNVTPFICFRGQQGWTALQEKKIKTETIEQEVIDQEII